MDIQFLEPAFEDLSQLSALALAQVGDAVYELMTRTYLCAQGACTAEQLHSRGIRLVNASAQAEAAARILPLLTEQETAVWRRGRNARADTIPRGCSRQAYQTATALESLWGWLFLCGQRERLQYLFSFMMEAAARQPAHTRPEHTLV